MLLNVSVTIQPGGLAPMKANAELRAQCRAAEIPMWKIGQIIGVSEMTIYRWLRTELPEEKRAAFRRAIDQIKSENAIA